MAQRRRADSDFVRLSLRLREALRRRLAAAAQDNNTTLNGEILDRLEASFLHEETKVRLGQEARAVLRDAGMEEFLEQVRQLSKNLRYIDLFAGGLSTLSEVLKPIGETQAPRLNRGKPQGRARRPRQAQEEKV